MINSCSECTSICCKHGPGPHVPLSPQEYLENFGTTDAYNTKCMALTDENKCSLWGTPSLPTECRTYVCQSKLFTKEQIKRINDVEERKCLNCGSEWTLMYETTKGNWINECEVCDFKINWKGTSIKKGKRKFKSIQ